MGMFIEDKGKVYKLIGHSHCRECAFYKDTDMCRSQLTNACKTFPFHSWQLMTIEESVVEVSLEEIAEWKKTTVKNLRIKR